MSLERPTPARPSDTGWRENSSPITALKRKSVIPPPPYSSGMLKPRMPASGGLLEEFAVDLALRPPPLGVRRGVLVDERANRLSQEFVVVVVERPFAEDRTGHHDSDLK